MSAMVRGMVCCLGLLLVCWGGGCSYQGYKNFRTGQWPAAPGVILKAYPNTGKDSGKGHWTTIEMDYSYEVDEREYTNNRVRYGMTEVARVKGRYKDGQAVRVFYDPGNPGVSVLLPGGPADWLFWTGLGAIPGFPGVVLLVLAIYAPAMKFLGRHTRLDGFYRRNQAAIKGAGGCLGALLALPLLLIFAPIMLGPGFIIVVPLLLVVGYKRGWVKRADSQAAPGTATLRASSAPELPVNVGGGTAPLSGTSAHGIDFRRAKYSVFSFGYGMAGCLGVLAGSLLCLAVMLVFLFVVINPMLGEISNLLVTPMLLLSVGIPLGVVFWIPKRRMRMETSAYLARYRSIHAARSSEMERMTARLHMRPATSPPECALHCWRSVEGYPLHTFEARMGEYPVYCFDYHDILAKSGPGSVFDTPLTTSERSPVDFTVVSVVLPTRLPALVVYPERAWDQLAKRAGGIDIEMDSLEFSEGYRVWAKDRRFAYAMCHGLLMEFLLGHPRAALSIAGDVMSFRYPDLAPLDELQAFLAEMARNRAFVPRYLLDDRTARDNGLVRLAEELGFHYLPQDSQLVPKHELLASITSQGDNQAYNRMEGLYHGNKVRIFDYHHKNAPGDKREVLRTLMILFQDWNAPETHVMQRAALAHNPDVTREEAVYDASGTLGLWSADKRLAMLLQTSAADYDFFSAARDGLLSIEVDGRCFAFAFNGLLQPEEIRQWIDSLVGAAKLFKTLVDSSRKPSPTPRS